MSRYRDEFESMVYGYSFHSGDVGDEVIIVDTLLENSKSIFIDIENKLAEKETYIEILKDAIGLVDELQKKLAKAEKLIERTKKDCSRVQYVDKGHFCESKKVIEKIINRFKESEVKGE